MVTRDRNSVKLKENTKATFLPKGSVNHTLRATGQPRLKSRRRTVEK